MVKKSLKKTKKLLSFTVVFEPDLSGGYVVSVPSLPGCVTQGETFEEATAMIKDAIVGYLATAADEGLEIPQETNVAIVTQVKVPSFSAL